MQPSQRVLLILFCLCWTSLGATFPGLRYLGDIGDLGMPGSSRTSVRFGSIQAVWIDDGVRFQGRDDDGKSWRAALPVATGIAYTDVWQADFDHNSRQDLLIAAHSFGSGRCVDEVMLSFLLFDNRGRPVPWVIRTRAPSFHVPAIFADLNHNGRAELVVTDCAYGDPALLGEDRSVTGVYEARDATWSLVKPAHLESYIALVRRSHRIRPRLDQLLPANLTDWPDQGNQPDPHEPLPLQVAALLASSEGCRAPVHLPPVVDGKLQTAAGRTHATNLDTIGFGCLMEPFVTTGQP